MEYTFKKIGIKEILRVKSDSHTDLSGFQEVLEEYPDRTVMHYFRITRKIDSKEDSEGKCYDWYEIDRHYTDTDKTKPIAAKIDENAEFTEDAICELDIALDERMSALEDAVCELSILMTGGE